VPASNTSVTDASGTDARRRLAAGRPDAQTFLPLTPAVFHILLALADADRHGYGIAKEVAARTTDQVRLGPGTLYGTLTRMVEAGFVEERPRQGRAAAGDERRRYYRITTLGRDVARAEARRLAALVDVARAKALLAPER
jgi:DNA-binding PadR family transcriptional regulator